MSRYAPHKQTENAAPEARHQFFQLGQWHNGAHGTKRSRQALCRYFRANSGHKDGYRAIRGD